MAGKIRLPNVTLVCVSNVKIASSCFALWRSSRCIKFGGIKLITTKAVPNVRGITIEHPTRSELASIDEYSRFMIYELWQHVETDWVLVVQWDGYVLNPQLWDSNFYSFDYIGAPWPLIKGLFIQPNGKVSRVGNGGFSFRSKKLLEIPNTNPVVWDTSRDARYHHTGTFSEDGNICVHNRGVYEAAGCRFAPLDVALKFSVEEPVPEATGEPTFGFHKNLPKRYWGREILYFMGFMILCMPNLLSSFFARRRR